MSLTCVDICFHFRASPRSDDKHINQEHGADLRRANGENMDACNTNILKSPYFANAYNGRQKCPCPYVAYRSKAIFSTQSPSRNAHEYVVRYVSAQRKLTDFYLEVESCILVVFS